MMASKMKGIIKLFMPIKGVTMETKLFVTFKPCLHAAIKHLSLGDIYRHAGKLLKYRFGLFYCMRAN